MNKQFAIGFSSIVITLLIGILLGALLTGFVVKHRIHDTMSFSKEQRMKHKMYKILEPVSAEQHQMIDPIIQRHSKAFAEQFKRHRYQLHQLGQDFEAELSPHLNAQQKQAFEKYRQRIKKRHKKHQPRGQ